MNGETVLVVDVILGKDKTQLVLTENAIWIPKERSSSMGEVPDLPGMMLGTFLNSRKLKTVDREAIDAKDLLSNCSDPQELQRKLISVATCTPYSSILRCFLARPGRFRRPKLAFDTFEETSRRVISHEFRIAEDVVDDLENWLFDLIPDRLEVH
jgi:hypothetical protein